MPDDVQVGNTLLVGPDEVIQCRLATTPPGEDEDAGSMPLEQFKRAKGVAERVLGCYREGVCRRTYAVEYSDTPRAAFVICVEWYLPGLSAYTVRDTQLLEDGAVDMAEVALMAQQFEQHAARVFFEQVAGRKDPT